jgi:hypothetical protein
MIAPGDRRRLDAEDHKHVEEHLKRRAAPGRPGSRSEVANFERLEDMDLSDDAVSQTHAMIFVDEAGASLVDVMATNGTFVNGQKISDKELVDGDLLRIGETRIKVTTRTQKADS